MRPKGRGAKHTRDNNKCFRWDSIPKIVRHCQNGYYVEREGAETEKEHSQPQRTTGLSHSEDREECEYGNRQTADTKKVLIICKGPLPV